MFLNAFGTLISSIPGGFFFSLFPFKKLNKSAVAESFRKAARQDLNRIKPWQDLQKDGITVYQRLIFHGKLFINKC